MTTLKSLDVIKPIVSGLQNENTSDICRKLLALLAADEDQKRKIADIIIRDVRNRKISSLLS